VAIKPPTASPAAQPSAFFIKPIKKGSPSMRVKEDFTPFKNTHIPDPAQIAPTWGAFTGKSYRAMWPPAHGPPEEDPNLAGAVHHLPPGPPGGFNPYQQYQPPNFQPQQPQQQRFPQPGPLQGQPQPPQLPPHMAGPPINGGFQHFQGMAFPQPGVPPHGQPMFSPQQMAAGQAGVAPPGQFIRYPQFPPQQAQPGQQGKSSDGCRDLRLSSGVVLTTLCLVRQVQSRWATLREGLDGCEAGDQREGRGGRDSGKGGVRGVAC